MRETSVKRLKMVSLHRDFSEPLVCKYALLLFNPTMEHVVFPDPSWLRACLCNCVQCHTPWARFMITQSYGLGGSLKDQPNLYSTVTSDSPIFDCLCIRCRPSVSRPNTSHITTTWTPAPVQAKACIPAWGPCARMRTPAWGCRTMRLFREPGLRRAKGWHSWVS